MPRSKSIFGFLIAVLLAGCGDGANPPAQTEKLAAGVSIATQANTPALADSVAIPGYRANYAISKAADTGLVTLTNKITNASQSYAGVTLFKFVDMHTSLDTKGPESEIYRLYQAAFNRKPDVPGLGFWVQAYRNGVSVDAIAGGFIASGEFKAMYGDNVTDEKFTLAAYANVLHRAPEQSGLDFWVAALKNGAARPAVLHGFSESVENQTNLLIDIENGFDFILPRTEGDPIIPNATSYDNAKKAVTAAIDLPPSEQMDDAFALADFKQNGKLSLFTTRLTYHADRPLNEATASVFAFWNKDATGAWLKDETMIDTPAGCLHPRKAAVADINGDGKPDIVVACHGYDAAPFPGEQIWLVMSTPTKQYQSFPMAGYKGFFHSVTVADINGDKLPDIVATDNFNDASIRVFLNKGNGVFAEAVGYVPPALAHHQYFTVELVDIDLNGKLDLLIGGHEWDNSPITIVYGNGTADFSNGKLIALPAVANYGIALDFVVRADARTIYVARTSGGDGTFYQGAAIQKIDLATNTSTLVFASRSVMWFSQLIETTTGVSSEVTARPAAALF
jgi:hypothetical protein